MLTKREVLETALKGLESGFFEYDWTKHAHCNCGVVMQCAFNVSGAEFKKKYVDSNKLFVDDIKTWTDAVRSYCTVTGKSTKQLFNDLYEYGFTPDGLMKLEFLSDAKILAKTDILETAHIKREIVDTTRIPIFGGLLRKKVETTRVVTEPDTKYYMRKHNVIKYLRAWIEILKEEDVTYLQQELQQCILTQNYERADEIKKTLDKIQK